MCVRVYNCKNLLVCKLLLMETVLVRKVRREWSHRRNVEGIRVRQDKLNDRQTFINGVTVCRRCIRKMYTRKISPGRGPWSFRFWHVNRRAIIKETWQISSHYPLINLAGCIDVPVIGVPFSSVTILKGSHDLNEISQIPVQSSVQFYYDNVTAGSQMQLYRSSAIIDLAIIASLPADLY